MDDGWRDVLAGTRRDVVDDCGAHWEDAFEMGDDAFE